MRKREIERGEGGVAQECGWLVRALICEVTVESSEQIKINDFPR